MRTFSIHTLGCKVNQYESRQIREFLTQLGLSDQTSRAPAELVVINTCCVTQAASAKSRQQIRRAQKQNPDSAIVVCGCLPMAQTGELHEPCENIHLIRHRESIAAALSQIVNGKTTSSDLQGPQTRQNCIKTKNNPKIKYKNKLTNPPKLPLLTSFEGQTRAFLKIQDGCDGYCSYCIIPKTRPHVQNKPADAVLQEAQQLVRAGHKEIVLTGIFLGAYGQGTVRRKNWVNQTNNELAKLLDKMAQIPNLARIRLSSLEPADITPKLLDTFCRHRNIMPHLHLSLQSGSDKILSRMCRQYTAEESRETIELIKSRLDRPAITADFIVGYPGETDGDFQQTVELAQESGFAKMHVFSFSPRSGTVAAGLQATVNTKVIKARSKILRNLDTELAGRFRQLFIGTTDTVLIENNKNGWISGRSERYFTVYFDKNNGNLKRNDLVKVKLIQNREDGVFGQCPLA